MCVCVSLIAAALSLNVCERLCVMCLILSFTCCDSGDNQLQISRETVCNDRAVEREPNVLGCVINNS